MGIGALGAAIGGLAGGYAKGVQIRDEMESNALKRDAMQLQLDKAKREDDALKEYMSGNKAHDDEWDNGTGRFANFMPKAQGGQPPAEVAAPAPVAENPTAEAAPAEPVVAPVRSPGDAAAPAAKLPSLTSTPVTSDAEPVAAPAAPAATATAATPAAAPAQAAAKQVNPFLKGSGHQYGSNYQDAADSYYGGKSRLLQDYFIKTGRPDLAQAVPEQMDKLRQGDFLRSTRGGFAALAAGNEEAANALVPRAWGMIGDGTDIVPGTLKHDPKTMNWTMTIKGADGTERQRVMTQKEIWSMAEQVTPAAVAKYNVEQLAKRADRLEKYQDKLYEPYTLKPGEKRQVMDPNTGKVVTIGQGDVPAGYEVMTDASGNTVLRKIDASGRSSGTGAGTGAGGKAPKTELDRLDDLLDTSMSKLKGSEAGSAQYLLAKDYGRRWLTEAQAAGRQIPAEVAARVAERYAMDPTKAQHTIDLTTGGISKVMKDDETGETFVVRGNVGNALNIPNGPDGKPVLDAKQMRAGAEQVIGAVDSLNPGLGAMYRAAAFDETGQARRVLEDRLRADATAAASKSPTFQKFTPEQQKAHIDRVLASANLDQKLTLVKNFGEKPKVDKPTLGSRLGLNPPPTYVPDPKSPAARSQARQAELKAANEKTERDRVAAQQALSKQFQADKASMDPLEFVRKYDTQRRALPQSDVLELREVERTLR